MSKRSLISVILMLTLSPILAVTTLVCSHPERWGGSRDPLSILVMSAFGLITIPLWLTYIPAIIITPLVMRRIAVRPDFRALPLPVTLTVALLVGAIAGICVVILPVIMSLSDSLSLAFNWASAGAVSGAVTLALITMIYRYDSHAV